MAERNPTVPSERRKEMEARSSVEQRESRADFTQEQAELNQRQQEHATQQMLDDLREKTGKTDEADT